MKPEYENKIDRLISRKYKAKLMNNTKWREVFTCIARLDIRFHIAWIDDANAQTNALHRVSLHEIGERGLHDSGIGGPFHYKEIHCVRIPKVFRVPKTMRGEVYDYDDIEQDVDVLLAAIRRLGQLPLTETGDYVEIHGYV